MEVVYHDTRPPCKEVILFKTHLLFKGGSAREAASTFFSGLGATMPPIVPPAPLSQPQPASGVIPLDPPRSRSRKKVTPGHARVGGDHQCACCDKMVGARSTY